MFKPTQAMQLLGIETPIIQAGMVWVSGGKLAAAAANAGALGIIGAGSMKPDLLKQHIEKAKTLTNKSLAVNVPLLYKDVESQLKVALESGIRIFFTSAGSPKKYTSMLKDHGAVVVHVTSTPELAIKCEEAGVDAVVAEGFEAGGHNGRDEITTMVLIPQVVDAVKIPVIAAGGIANGRQIIAALALGAQAVQMGSRFAVTRESSAHENFKKAIMNSKSGDTKLMMKNLVPVRLLKNKFYEEVAELEAKCADAAALKALLGKGRAKAGMLEGDIERGELEIGQVSALIRNEPTCAELMTQLQTEMKNALSKVNSLF
ncbi:MAG: nitronate monooxygenase [Bdellovibrio sp.]